MKITTVRRVSQIFFLGLFIWFCIVSSLGTKWWQLRGWPINWLMQLDPLIAISTIITTHTLYTGLAWAIVTVILTTILGRFFCGWVCPFGSMHQFFGYLGKFTMSFREKVSINQYHHGQVIKYYLLLFLLAAAMGNLLANWVRITHHQTWGWWVLLMILLSTIMFLAVQQIIADRKKMLVVVAISLCIWVGLGFFFSEQSAQVVSLQTGLLDPIPLVYRSINLVILPIVDSTSEKISTSPRYYQGAWSVGFVFVTALLLNLRFPRFYCHYVCPLGALFGVIGRFALWRIGKRVTECSNCQMCESNCEGACHPFGEIRISECLMCMNCLYACKKGEITYQTSRSAAGEITSPDISRRGFLVSLISGFAAVPISRLGGMLGTNWNNTMVRPPGALSEPEFLSRCLKCGQCMRVCPTNVIQPAGLEGGVEALWTPVLNFRIGTSGCQLNCIACGHVCPTAAIAPLSLDEKRGRGAFAHKGPVRIGTAFVDRGRCLPWAMNRPCIVCEENCPVSPKAIYVEEIFAPLYTALSLKEIEGNNVDLYENSLSPGEFSSGDYYCNIQGDKSLHRIASNGTNSIVVSQPWENPPEAGSRIEIQVCLQRPWVDPKTCIGCGVCQHECPVSGLRAIRVTAENESRTKHHAFTS